VAQARNYLKLLGLEEAYLINFSNAQPEIVHVPRSDGGNKLPT
jgi:hypothetical protein